MSWSGSAKLDPTSTFAVDDIKCTGQTDVPTEMAREVSEAKAAAVAMLQSHTFDNAEEVLVQLSGHANPKHAARDGSSGDSITVSIAITKYKATTAPLPPSENKEQAD